VSRKWERKVERNSKLINKQRKRFGQPPIGSAPVPQADKDVFRGRSLVLPLLLVSVAVFFAFVNGQVGKADGMYWFTVIMYFLLGFYFFMKRPYLSVKSSAVATRRLGREKAVPASEIASIEIMPDYCIIAMKNKRTKWVFSRFMNRYNTEAMGLRLREFAAQHQIPLK
jgi:hypothetical protein